MNFHCENIIVPHLNNGEQLPDLIALLSDELFFRK
jgi:hypothetical protein